MNEQLLRQACDRYNEKLAELNECAVMALPPMSMAQPASLRAALELLTEGTPSSRWLKDGTADPHGDRYDCQRAKLAYGHLTDDEMANEVFTSPNMMSATGAKDRIRWLSRVLEKATRRIAILQDALTECQPAIRAWSAEGEVRRSEGEKFYLTVGPNHWKAEALLGRVITLLTPEGK